MRAALASGLVWVALLFGTPPTSAHHSFSAEFDVKQPISLQGTLTKWEMINPHSWFHIDVKGPDGKVIPWLVEGGSPNQLIRMGVTKNTVALGTELVIEGYRARDGTYRAVGRNFVLADGRRLFIGADSGTTAPAKPLPEGK